jgi:hypothetical protein
VEECGYVARPLGDRDNLDGPMLLGAVNDQVYAPTVQNRTA